jgi:prolipoprotein diacylglyceryl transferase
VGTHWDFYFGEGANPLSSLFIWEGGIAIYGALIGGAIGAWLGCRWTGIRFWTFADALAPGLLLAQAIGRFGNWFNQELFGLPTDLPWGLEIDSDNPAFPPGLAPDTLFHPTFLYEVLWNGLGVIVLLWAGRKFRLQWGRLFALYLIWYSAGRIVWESIRIDQSEIILGLRTNVWAAIFGVVLGIVIFFVQKRRHPGREPSPYVPGREWRPEGERASKPGVWGGAPAGTVQSQDTDDFVDVSEPPASEAVEATATSAATSRTP